MTMPKFKPGDRVRLTQHAIDKGYGYFSTRGIVLDVSTPDKILVGLSGEYTWLFWFDADRWEIDPAAIIVDEAVWLEQRAYDAAFARE